MSGMRVRNTWTFSLAGLCAPLYLTVSSLNDREMPPGKDMVVLKIPGLCIGGSGIGANTLDGFVVFMRKGNGNDKKRFQYYQKNVLIPYINWLRKEFAGYNIEDGTTIPDELTAVAWCDGDVSQLNSMTNEYKILRDQKIIANKQNAARTAVEQAADLMPVFKVFNKDAKKHTVTNVDASRHPMKMKVMIAFQSDEMKHLNLGPKKTASLIDFISVFPALATRAAMRTNIMHGGYQNGMIDEDKARYPVMNKVLSTCRQSIPNELYTKLIDNFSYLYKTAVELGHIPEEVYDEIGFPMDSDVHGKEVQRMAGISQESYQRAKWLTHEHQISLRLERVEMIQNLQRQQAESRRQKIDEECDNIQAIEELLLSMITDVDDPALRNLENCSIDNFAKLRSPQLAEFIFAHDPEMTAKKQIPSRLGDLSEVKASIENGTLVQNSRIFTAFMCRDKPNILREKLEKRYSQPQQTADEYEETSYDAALLVVECSNNDIDLGILPSKLLENTECVGLMRGCLDSI